MDKKKSKNIFFRARSKFRFWFFFFQFKILKIQMTAEEDEFHRVFSILIFVNIQNIFFYFQTTFVQKF